MRGSTEPLITLTSTDGRNKRVNMVQIVTEQSKRRMSARFFRAGIFDLAPAFGVFDGSGLLTRLSTVAVEGESQTEISFVVVAVINVVAVFAESKSVLLPDSYPTELLTSRSSKFALRKERLKLADRRRIRSRNPLRKSSDWRINSSDA